VPVGVRFVQSKNSAKTLFLKSFTVGCDQPESLTHGYGFIATLGLYSSA